MAKSGRAELLELLFWTGIYEILTKILAGRQAQAWNPSAIPALGQHSLISYMSLKLLLLFDLLSVGRRSLPEISPAAMCAWAEWAWRALLGNPLLIL